MAAAIRDSHPDADVELIKGGGGDFIVITDGRQIPVRGLFLRLVSVAGWSRGADF